MAAMQKAITVLGVAACMAVAAMAPAQAWQGRPWKRGGHREGGHALRARGRGDWPLPAGVRRIADIPYGSDPAQRLDAYVPDHPNGEAVLLVHGGGWRHGDKGDRAVVANKVAHWSARGIVVLSVDYRLLPGADPLRQAGDVAAALAHAQRHAREWGADPGGFVLVGHSAGAHLVALLDADPSLARAAGASPWRGTVALDSAALDVPDIMRARHLPLYDDAFGSDPAYWRAASPTLRLTQAAPPMLLVCSSQRATSCAQARGFASAARRLGARAETLPEALSHRQINETLGEPGAYTDAVDRFLASLPASARP